MYSALVIVPEVVVTVSEGLCFTLQGYKVGGERVYRAELKQGRVPCACLYTEQEYKDLVVEAHYTCIITTTRTLGRRSAISIGATTVMKTLATRMHFRIIVIRTSVISGEKLGLEC